MSTSLPAAPGGGQRHGLRRPADATRCSCPREPRRARALPGPVHAHPRRRVPGHELGPERARRRCWPAATATRGGRRRRPVHLPVGGAPTSATFSTSRRPSPTPPLSPSTRTPLDPDHSGRGQRGHRQQRRRANRRHSGPSRRAVTRSSATGPRTSRRGAWVAHEIMRLRADEGLRWGDVAIFYRTNAQSRGLEEALVRDRGPLQGGRRHPLLRPRARSRTSWPT